MTRFETNSPATRGQDGRSISARDLTEVAVSAIGGMAIGAGLMYLFDPQSGTHRREHLSETASEAAHAVADRAKDLGGYVSDRVSSLTSAVDAGEIVSDYADRARNIAGSVADSARSAIGNLRGRSRLSTGNITSAARNSLSRASSLWRSEPRGFSAATTGISALGALALGLGAMYFLDPDRGRSRRAWVLQKANRVMNETGDFARKTGTHLRNKAKGLAHETGLIGRGGNTNDFTLAERVRSALGRIGAAGAAIGVSAENGIVTLGGRCDSELIGLIEDTCRSVPGVWDVRIEQLQALDREPGTLPTAYNPGA
jgi:osmotically-inducible protein OsmY